MVYKWLLIGLFFKKQLSNEGRGHDSGIFKLEPRELANVGATAIAELIPDPPQKGKAEQMAMSGGN